jgi:SAM-dependent methyltransferase
MSHCITIEPVVLGLVPDDLKNMRILDVGIGHGQWGFILRSRKLGHPYIVGIEPHPQYIEWAKRVGLYDELHNMTAQQYLAGNPDTKFDAILICEVVEHDTRENSIKLLKDLEARLNQGGRIILSTPLGHSAGAPDYDGNALNAHPSGFRPEDFTRLGYSVEEVEREGSLNRLGHIVGPIAWVWFTLRRGRRPVTHSVVAWKDRG